VSSNEPRKIQLKLSPQAERYARSDAPREARLMAARGALPLPPIELATVLFVLHHDPDPEIKSLARDSLEALPDSVCNTVLSGETHPSVISHLAHAFKENPERLEKIALNAATDDATIAFLATLPYKAIVDILSNNQERMLRCSEIVEALGSNPLTGRSVIERILSFLGVEGVGENTERSNEEINDDDAAAALRAVLGDEMGSFARELVEESEGDDAQAEGDTGDDGTGSIYSLIQKMTIVQKIKLARVGNKEARSLLVRDRNRVIAMAAIMSPKVGDSEVATIAASRNVSDDVLRTIARNREWTRNYQVKHALATNPRCPQAEAMKYVNYLQDKDLRQIMRSKDIPTVISNHARRILTKKGKV
jgi:hypothetical protein